MKASLCGAEVLLVGGSGGIGSALVQRLVQEQVASIAIAAHQLSDKTSSSVPITTHVVDLTDAASVQALAQQLRGKHLTHVINCAGVNSNDSLFCTNAAVNARREMEVNYFGFMHLAHSFAPLLTQHGGVMMSVLSFLSQVTAPALATYSASKAAAHALNQALRAELRPQGVRVCGVYPMAVDTSMSSHQQGPKMSPEMLADEMVRFLAGEGDDLYPGEALQAHTAWLRDPEGFQAGMLSA